MRERVKKRGWKGGTTRGRKGGTKRGRMGEEETMGEQGQAKRDGQSNSQQHHRTRSVSPPVTMALKKPRWCGAAKASEVLLPVQSPQHVVGTTCNLSGPVRDTLPYSAIPFRGSRWRRRGLSLRGIAVTTETAITAETAKTVTSKMRARYSPEPPKPSKPSKPQPSWRPPS